jgi:hypothetical protein
MKICNNIFPSLLAFLVVGSWIGDFVLSWNPTMKQQQTRKEVSSSDVEGGARHRFVLS